MNNRLDLNKTGMTLPELLIAAAIMAFAITGILVSYLRCMELNEISQNTSKAVKAASSRLEQIRGTAFASVKAAFHNVAFDINGLNGKGVSYVNDTNPDLLLVDVCVSWRQKNGRMHGEDRDLDGQIDAGEDGNGNGMLDAPVRLTSYIFER